MAARDGSRTAGYVLSAHGAEAPNAGESVEREGGCAPPSWQARWAAACAGRQNLVSPS